jgi:hypothetical protein
MHHLPSNQGPRGIRVCNQEHGVQSAATRQRLLVLLDMDGSCNSMSLCSTISQPSFGGTQRAAFEVGGKRNEINQKMLRNVEIDLPAPTYLCRQRCHNPKSSTRNNDKR